MRYLHPIAAHEIFIAQGRYRYYKGDELLPIDEQWTIHELKGGARLVRVDEDARHQDGLTVMSEALYNDDGQLERFNLVSDNPQDPQTQQLKADYTFMHNYVQIGRRIAKGEHEYEERQLLENTQVYIRQTIFMGFLIKKILANAGKSHVFAPQIVSDTPSEMLRIQVQAVQRELLTLGRRTIPTTCYQLADDIFYWLDDHDIVIKRQYTHADEIYSVWVSDYAYR
jgi:hypothetical protein